MHCKYNMYILLCAHTYISETMFLESVFVLLFSCTKSCACAQMYNSHILYNVCYKKYIYHLMFIICVSVFTCTLPIFYTINIYTFAPKTFFVCLLVCTMPTFSIFSIFIYICTKKKICIRARVHNAHVFYIFYI